MRGDLGEPGQDGVFLDIGYALGGIGVPTGEEVKSSNWESSFL